VGLKGIVLALTCHYHLKREVLGKVHKLFGLCWLVTIADAVEDAVFPGDPMQHWPNGHISLDVQSCNVFFRL